MAIVVKKWKIDSSPNRAEKSLFKILSSEFRPPDQTVFVATGKKVFYLFLSEGVQADRAGQKT
jgi:hypothetical protein